MFVRGLSNDVLYHNLREVLAMAVFAAIAFTTLFLEHDDFVALDELTLDFAYDFCSFNGRSADLDGTVGIHEQNAVELYGFAFLGLLAEIVDIEEFILLSFELLSLNFNNYVHLLNCEIVNSAGRTFVPAWSLTGARYGKMRCKVNAFN